MTIHPITPTTPACYGVCCERHAECARYALVEGPVSRFTIATCDSGKGEKPLFAAMGEQARAA